MNAEKYTKSLIEKFGTTKAINLLDKAIDVWTTKSKYPEIHGADICKRTIVYFTKCKNLCIERQK